MLLSVYTPTHDATSLKDVWRCLLAQDFREWEWVIVPNGSHVGAIRAYITELVGNDHRVRVFPAPEELKGVGALKRFSVEQCKGDVFVEVDHDDLITPDCLSSIAVEAIKAATPTFIFSDSVTYHHDGKPDVFDRDYGWRHYKADVLGKNHVINTTPPVTARSLCDILYTPDHVRAWTRDAYEKAGGYDPRLPIGDDHDLVSRTYLSGSEFKFINRPLYVHRLTPHTTSQTRLGEIAAVSRQIRDKRTHLLVGEWCRRNHMAMFDLGGAHDCPPGFTPIDANLPEGMNGLRGDVFYILDSLPDSSVGCFRAFDFLEHIQPNRVVPLMNLLYRKLVPGGWMLTHTPAVCDDEGRTGRGAYQDPTHVSFWSSNNFWYYTDRKYAKYVPEIQCRFQTVRVGNWYPSGFHKMHLIPYVIWDAIALKNDDEHYFPGPRSI